MKDESKRTGKLVKQLPELGRGVTELELAVTDCRREEEVLHLEEANVLSRQERFQEAQPLRLRR